MNRIRKTDCIIIAVLLAAIIAVTLTVMSGGGSDSGYKPSDTPSASVSDTASEPDYSDYNGKRIGIRIGTSFESISFDKFPDSEYSYYDTETDLVTALKNKTIDAFLTDEPSARMIHTSQPDVDYIKKNIMDDDYHFGFQKGTERSEKLKSEFNTVLRKLRDSGELDKMKEKWTGTDESVKTLDSSGLTGENGTLSVCTLADYPPFFYLKDNKLIGYAIEITTIFAREYGYNIKYEYGTVASCLAGLAAGKYDLFAASLSYTKERAQSIDFSDVIYEGGISLVVRTDDMGSISASAGPGYTGWNNKRLGIRTGTSMESLTPELFPDAEYRYYESESDLITALTRNKIDGYLDDEPVARMVHQEQSNIAYLKKPIVEDDYHFGFQKGTEKSAKLMSEFDTVLGKLKRSGELRRMKEKWTGSDESAKTFDNSELTSENGTLTIAVLPDYQPFSYVSNNELTGYAVELVTIFAREYGYALEFEYGTCAACIAGLSSGKYDIIASSLSYTEERAQSIDFSDVIYNGGVSLVVRSEDIGGESASNAPDYTDYNGRRMGIHTGAVTEGMTLELFPDSEYSYYNSATDLISALQNDKIDGFIEDINVARMIHESQNDVDYIKNKISNVDTYAGFPKNEKKYGELKKQFNTVLAKLKDSGELDKITDKWLGDDESVKTFDESGLTGENGTLNIAVMTDCPPFSYIEGNKLQGYIIEIMTIFAREYGYKLNYEYVNVTSGLAGLTTEKYDIFAAYLVMNEERKQSIDFSDAIYNCSHVLVVRSSDLSGTAVSSEEKGFFAGLRESFEKNFIREDRYKLILEGIGTTCAITFLTVLFGSILAFLICLLRRTDSLLANKIANLYVRLLQGTPMVVLLMILYYVVFGKSGISAIWVAVIGFSLNFAAYVSETLRSGIESIDGGQHEAALALGFSENQAFFRFIFPQAAVRQLPVYRGEIISLLKNTSIVGYIAIQDLTKMSDIIRSRTYEAFFPLIATAIIYFIIAWVITIVLNIILKRIDPRSRRRGTK